MLTTPTQTAPELPTHLLCTVGPLTLGFEALWVREVMAMPLVTPFSQAAPLVAGALNLRGRVVPVLDLRAALALEITPPRARENLVILESGERIIAVRVDEVRDVQRLADAARTRQIAPGGGFTSGLAQQGAALIQLIDTEAIFAAALSAPTAPIIEARAPGLTPEFAPEAGANWRAAWFSVAPDEREILQARAAMLALPLEDAGARATNAQLMAAAILGGELFGFGLQWVREFAPLPTITRVPLGPPEVKGVLNLRGEILPLLDVRHALGMRTMEPEKRENEADATGARARMEVIVVEHQNVRAAIWVEEVLDVFAVQTEIVAVGARHQSAELLAGVVAYKGQTLAVLDLPKLIGELMGTKP